MFRLRGSIISCIILVFVICWSSAGTSSASTDYWPTEGWRTSTLEEQGMHSGKLADMMEFIQYHGFMIDSITIIRNGYLVTDAYFYPFQKDIKHIIYSCTKSITSALVGIAVDKGYIKSINQPVLDFFPEKTFANLDERKRAITLEHLLTMSSGLKCRDSYQYNWSGLGEMMKSTDWAQYILDLPMAEAPGEWFEYCNGVSYLLSVIIQRATNMRTLDFARKYLFGPLGITDVKWRTNTQGVDIGFMGMRLTPHDMAKIGWLYLNKGSWDGRQIISAKWIEASTKEHISGTLASGYGYQWWIDSSEYYLAAGYGGQFIFVVPEKNMVVVFTSDPDGYIFTPITLLENNIIPAAVSSKPLPADPKNEARLDYSLNKSAKALAKGLIWTSEREGVAKNGLFVRTAPPAFKFEYPIGSMKKATTRPNQIMAMRTPGGLSFRASVINIPEDLKLADIGPKFYANILLNLGVEVKVVSNKEIILKDGTKAYRTELEWLWQGTLSITTIVVSAFKEGEFVYLTTTSLWKENEEVTQIIESLTFK